MKARERVPSSRRERRPRGSFRRIARRLSILIEGMRRDASSMMKWKQTGSRKTLSSSSVIRRVYILEVDDL
ncbi:hypothetical protein NL676_032488 [Syzygium grande]|nr:hypothetical protein NL676_032488 [Syzygium grande]